MPWQSRGSEPHGLSSCAMPRDLGVSRIFTFRHKRKPYLFKNHWQQIFCYAIITKSIGQQLVNVNIYFGVNRRFLEKYPRGRRGSPAKGVVRVNRSQGSNPCFSASTLKPYCSVGFFVVFLQGFPCFARGNVVAEPWLLHICARSALTKQIIWRNCDGSFYPYLRW